MQTLTHEQNTVAVDHKVHPLSPEDAAFMATLRAMAEPNKGKLRGVAARAPFDAMVERVMPPEGVTYRSDTVGGIAGWWCSPLHARDGAAILHLHGGWFNFGSASAYRHLVGHIALRAGVEAFVPDYRLAPEHPFPAALLDTQACYAGLVERGIGRIALSGDSAGGNLALVLLSSAAALSPTGLRPVGAVALSPVTDLALTAPSWESRAAADFYFTFDQVAELVHAYLRDHALTDPLASPLYGDLAGLPPVRIHVGDEEVLLDDARRYVDKAAAAGVDARLDVWLGMPHGFASTVGKTSASAQALDAIGAFLAERLA